jgi:hypothetical protein
MLIHWSQCWIGFELAFVYFNYIETKGPTLEELAKVIDGDQAQVAHVDIVQVEKKLVMERENAENTTRLSAAKS